MFKFLDDAPLECGKPAPPVLVSCMEFSHVMYETLIMMIFDDHDSVNNDNDHRYESASQWVPAYDKLNSILEEANITMLDSDEPAAIPIAVR